MDTSDMNELDDGSSQQSQSSAPLERGKISEEMVEKILCYF